MKWQLLQLRLQQIPNGYADAWDVQDSIKKLNRLDFLEHRLLEVTNDCRLLCSTVATLRNNSKLPNRWPLELLEISPQEPFLEELNTTNFANENTNNKPCQPLGINAITIEEKKEIIVARIKGNCHFFSKFYPVIRCLALDVLQECNLKGVVIGDLAAFQQDALKIPSVNKNNYTSTNVNNCEIKLYSSRGEFVKGEADAAELRKEIQSARKKLGCQVDETILLSLNLPTHVQQFKEKILRECNAQESNTPTNSFTIQRIK